MDERNRTIILNKEAIRQKIRRIAYQIAEDNYEEKELYLIGLKTDGYYVAEKLSEEIKKILPVKVHLHSLRINKKNPLKGSMQYDFEPEWLNSKVVIFVDDVANTGRTMLYAMKPVMECLPRKVSVAVLVNRQHKRFPISCNYVGLSLATTLKEEIRVEITADDQFAYLI